jgi:hypothetical protein
MGSSSDEPLIGERSQIQQLFKDLKCNKEILDDLES